VTYHPPALSITIRRVPPPVSKRSLVFPCQTYVAPSSCWHTWGCHLLGKRLAPSRQGTNEGTLCLPLSVQCIEFHFHGCTKHSSRSSITSTTPQIDQTQALSNRSLFLYVSDPLSFERIIQHATRRSIFQVFPTNGAEAVYPIIATLSPPSSFRVNVRILHN
jgi:hypothetical protein